MRFFASLSIGVVAVLPFLEVPARAQAVIGGPGSALIFPVFQTGGGRSTLITVTNTASSRVPCGNGFLHGDVLVQYTYFSVAEGRCIAADRSRLLTPMDTITIIAGSDNPTASLGWLWVEARDPDTQNAINFDFLIGSAIIADGRAQFRMRYLPWSFRAHTPEVVPTDACGRGFTDGNHNGRADFDGSEYDFWPRHLYLDEFIQESSAVTSELFVASGDVDSTDGNDTTMSALIANNSERLFSRTIHFDCYLHESLSGLSAVVTNLLGDPNELRLGGHPVQMGWLDLVGSDPILAVFLQRVGTGSVAEGTVLQGTGTYGSFGDTGHTPCSLAR